MSQKGGSAWEQWGGKRPAGGTQDAFQSLLRMSPLSTASMASTDSERYSLKKMWDSARDLTQKAITTPSTSATDLEAMEEGAVVVETQDVDSSSVKWPLWPRKKVDATEASLLPTMSWNMRFKYFVGLTLMGLMFFGMSSIFMPLIMIRPSKFALSFTLGSMCLMGAFAMLKGPAVYVASLLEPKRLLLTTAYFLTLASTLYSCLVLGNYVFVVISSVLQLMTLSAFALSALPGGNASLKAFGMLFMKAARRMIQAFARLLR